MGDDSAYRIQKKASLDDVDGEIGQVNVVAEHHGLGMRHVQTLLMAIMSVMAYSLRANLSVAIVAMVRNKDDVGNNTSSTDSPTFDWDEETKGYVLGSFFCGYLITQIPAGILTEKFGGHRFLCAAIFSASLLTILTPQSAYIGGWKLVCANRVGQGISQGFVFPSVYMLLGVWAPSDERGLLTSLSLGGQLLGIVASTPLSGFISSYYGWPSVFYWFGATGVVVASVVFFLGADSPGKHRLISEKEKHYIHSSLGGAKVKLQLPWKHMFTNVPLWAATISGAFGAMVYLTFLMVVPSYLGTVLKFDITDNGLMSALPSLVCWLTSLVFSWACDLCISRGWMTLTTARKFFNSISGFGSAVCIALMPFTNTAAASVSLLTLSFALMGASFPGIQANFVDLAPNFSGTVFGLSNFLAACLGLCGPIIVGFIVTEAGSRDQWRTVLLLNAAFMVISNVVFIIWGTAETQWWNWPNSHEEENGSKEKEMKEIQLKPVA